MSADDTRLVEWGVKHSQGVRVETDERSARESLAWMAASFNRNFRNKVEPVLVRRWVTDWQPVTATEEQP